MSFKKIIEIVDISKYPFLRDIHEVRLAVNVLQDAQVALGSAILLAQQECPHPKWSPVVESNPHRGMQNYHGSTVYTGKECTKCAKFSPRKAGMPWEVCYACGEDMELISALDSEVKMSRCPQCGTSASSGMV